VLWFDLSILEMHLLRNAFIEKKHKNKKTPAKTDFQGLIHMCEKSSKKAKKPNR